MKENLLKNIKMLKNSADLVYNSNDTTSATILYFKLIFSIFDYIIFIKINKTPKDHTDRFRILKEQFPHLYEFLDKYFEIYRQTYTINIEKEKCEIIKNYVEEIINQYKIIK